MATVNTTDTLAANFKEVYASKLKDLRPSSTKVINDIDFIERGRSPGSQYHQPVQVQHEQGFTYAAGTSAGSGNSAGAFTLNDSIAGAIIDSTVVGYQKLLRCQMDYETAARASTTDRRAFYEATKLLVMEMGVAFKRRDEIDTIHGRTGIGIVDSVSTNDVTITDATWAPGIWSGSEGAQVTAWDAASATGTSDTRQDTAAGDSAGMTINGVNMDTKTITFDDATGVAQGDYLFFRGQRVDDTSAGNTGEYLIPEGVDNILGQSSGTLFGINRANYSLWQSPTHSMGSAPITFSKVNKGIVKPVGQGLEEDLVLYVNPNGWADLLEAETAVRRHPKKSHRYEVGGGEIQFYSQHGTLRIKSSLYVKEGTAYMLAPDLWLRVGATDVTFNLPGRGDEFFFHLPTQAGYELRAYENCSPFTACPAKSLVLTNIVNAA